jgi:TDG/mug DNA glycosylase family protein
MDIGRTAVFVLPSPSGQARRSWDIEPWRQLAAFVRDQPPGVDR